MADGLSIITGITYSKAMANAINSMTYFVDYNWQPSSTEATLPVVFFYITSMSEITRNEVSKETLILYDDASQGNANRVNAGLTQVLMDNIVLQPREFNIEAVIPFEMNQMNYFQRVNDMISVELDEKLSNGLYNSARGILKPLLKAISKGLKYNVNENFLENAFLFSTTQTQTQIASIRAMTERRLPVQMKLPIGWKFANAIITSLEMNKLGEEKDVMNARIQLLVDPPILTVKNTNASAMEAPYKSDINKANGDLMLATMKAISGARV